MTEHEHFCPYCGDDLNDEEDVEYAVKYREKFGVCPHWDHENKIDEF